MIRGITWTHTQVWKYSGPIPQTSNWSGTFFALSYSKLALALFILALVQGKRQTLSVGCPNGNVNPISYGRNNLSLQMVFLAFKVLP